MFSKSLRCQYVDSDGEQCEKLADVTTWVSTSWSLSNDKSYDTCWDHCESVIKEGEVCIFRSPVYVQGE